MIPNTRASLPIPAKDIDVTIFQWGLHMLAFRLIGEVYGDSGIQRVWLGLRRPPDGKLVDVDTAFGDHCLRTRETVAPTIDSVHVDPYM